MTDKKQLGGGKLITFKDVKDCFSPFSDTSIEFNKLNIFTGMNATGKSIILKLYWALGTTVNNSLLSSFHKLPYDSIQSTQYILDNTFTNQDINGEITLEFDNGSVFTKLEKGKVLQCDIITNAEVEFGDQPVYMSSQMRTFSSMVMYLKFKKALGINYDMSKFTESDMAKIMDSYRLYDVIYVELLLQKIKAKLHLHGEPKLGAKSALNEYLTKMGCVNDLQIHDIIYDETNQDILFVKDNITKSITSLSSGEQSLINMFLGSSIF